MMFKVKTEEDQDLLVAFINKLNKGAFDGELEHLNSAVVMRLKRQRQDKINKALNELRVGDKVKLTGLRGQHNGLIVTIKKINYSRFVANIWGRDFTIPLSAATKIEDESAVDYAGMGE